MAESKDTAPRICRLPPDGRFVSLTEAVTFIAFSQTMTCHDLIIALKGGELCEGNLEQAQDHVVNAIARLCDAGINGTVLLLGRRVNRGRDEKPETQPMTPSNLRDFRQTMFGTDNLYYGNGLAYRMITTKHSILRADLLHDHFADVVVDRATLLKAFPLGEAINPSATSNSPTAGAEGECRQWLVSEFAADPDKKLRKSDFQSAALAHFSGRLSSRAFIRAWHAVAPDAGRSSPGRKS